MLSSRFAALIAASNGGIESNGTWVGVVLALVGNSVISLSFILQKIAQMKASQRNVPFTKIWMWWLGLFCMVGGEFGNFYAFAFAPAALISPLGALGVIMNAILSFIFLKERMNPHVVVYALICAVVGSFTVMGGKGGSSLIQTTLSVSNQLFHPLPWILLALLHYRSSEVYYVLFTTGSILAGTILYQEFNDLTWYGTISFFLGVAVVFSGIYLTTSTPKPNEAAPVAPATPSPQPDAKGEEREPLITSEEAKAKADLEAPLLGVEAQYPQLATAAAAPGKVPQAVSAQAGAPAPATAPAAGAETVGRAVRDATLAAVGQPVQYVVHHQDLTPTDGAAAPLSTSTGSGHSGRIPRRSSQVMFELSSTAPAPAQGYPGPDPTTPHGVTGDRAPLPSAAAQPQPQTATLQAEPALGPAPTTGPDPTATLAPLTL
ncbi:putative magnesium transporter NIPA3 [Paratrimastix pyriformis]|uniref:Magnesium transporter NIPA3 n=1 Tax=Paratrimastix pyriformis TaxID=342808 RepID=A0ABQ8UHR7_9EUKA|nr:putative magnesium transporter NIPA3 [Paratrimastix pyriformis]